MLSANQIAGFFKCNISRKKWMVKCIFGLQISMEVFYKLILSFWLCVTRHAQSTQNKKFTYDCNWTRTHNHLVCKWTLNHLAKLAKWLSRVVSTYLYGALTVCSCHVTYVFQSGFFEKVNINWETNRFSEIDTHNMHLFY